MDVKPEAPGDAPGGNGPKHRRQRNRRKHEGEGEDDASKRRCVSTACIACRKRKSKCDGNTPACAACSSVYNTECVYDPNSDHRRKGVYKNDVDSVKKNTTLQTLISAMLNYQEEEAFELVREIRSCDNLDTVAEKIAAEDNGFDGPDEPEEGETTSANGGSQAPTFERQLYGKMGHLRLDEGSVRYFGGTSNLIHINEEDGDEEAADEYPQHENPITSWTRVTDDADLIMHLLNMYFTWHYTFFTTLAKNLFYRDFFLGRPPPNTRRKTHYCTPLLLNTMCALGCHFTSNRGARENPDDSATAGDHFFKEAKRLILENDEHERPRLTTVQALALMSVREAGCGREAKGWVYSGMSFRMLQDMALHLDSGQLTTHKHVNGDEAEEDVRRVTFMGCFLFDKCWSNYLGRLPQLSNSITTAPKVEVFPDEDSAQWSPYNDSGFSQAHAQPARTRAVALQITKLCEISSDLMSNFYNPTDIEKHRGKSTELKLLSSIHTRLEAWRKALPPEMEPREGCLSSVLTMHMFFQLLFIHLYRPFLKYTEATSPLPHTVSPRKLCTQSAQMISKLLRLYKRSYGLRQICNICVYIAHSACTIHLLNLPDKNARRDIIHGVKHLEEIGEGWLCARRTLGILSVLAKKWKIELPDEAAVVLKRTDQRFGPYAGDAQPRVAEMSPAHFAPEQYWQHNDSVPTASAFSNIPQTQVAATAPPTTIGVPPHSDNYIPTPHIANDIRTQQYPSTSATPTQRVTNGQKPSSPSNVFGGVEQLIRDSSDWVYRDQAAYGAGFDNWTGMDMNPVTWTNTANGSLNGFDPASTGMSLPNTQQPTYGNAGYPMMDWNSNMMYDEAEWYQ